MHLENDRCWMRWLLEVRCEEHQYKNVNGQPPAKFPIPMCNAIPTPRLYCPARLFPSLQFICQHVAIDIFNRNLPCNDTRECSVGSRDAEEGAKVLDSNRYISKVDSEADSAHNEAGKNERVPHLDPVRPHSEDQENNRYGNEGMSAP